MGELKSAWEVAQERANRLGKLSAEEKEQQERHGYRQIGQALAQKWLDSPNGPDMTMELSKYEKSETGVIKQSMIERLAEAVELQTARGTNRVQKVLEAITTLKPELQPEVEEIGRLAQEYELAEQKMRQELGSKYSETLHQLRISGTAVDSINIEANSKWQPAQQELIQVFAPRLNELKHALTS
jgi:hypothetical protein